MRVDALFWGLRRLSEACSQTLVYQVVLWMRWISSSLFVSVVPISIHHSSELLFPCKVQIMTFLWIKISYLCLLNNTQVLQWIIKHLSPTACALPPSLLALQSLLPWPPLNTLLCVHRILSAWKALLHPMPHVLDELLRLNPNVTFSMAIPPTLARRSPFPSTSPQHLHTVNQLLSSLRSITFCFMIPSVLVECELSNGSVVC